MKDLGLLKYFLGVEVARSPAGIYLCQCKYALNIIKEAGLLGSKPAEFPMDSHHRLTLSSGPILDDLEPYRWLVGRLIYLCFTRPELAYSIHILSQFMQKPTLDHWNATLWVVCFLKGHPGQGILLKTDADLQLTEWCDSDWASCPLSHRSLSSWIIFLCSSPIAWKTKKQHTVSRSSAEAEYRSMATITCELKWLKGVLAYLQITHKKPIKLLCDSQSTLHIVNNPVFHECSKYIEVDCHFLRDEIINGTLLPSYVCTDTQLADIFTKALGKVPFQQLLSNLGIKDLYAPTWGG